VAETDPITERLERKLATILSADVAAYSRLMAEEEEHTLHVFRGHKEVFEQLVALHRGRVFNTAGDAILAEFGSAVEAVRCATEIQAALRTRNDQWPEARRVEFRVGVNLGDVMVRGADLLGDGVNVAARLQAAAEPGGICIAGSVYDQIRNKLSLSFKSLGEMSYKNIPQPVRTFAISEANGVGPLPSPAVPDGRKADGMRRFWILAAAVLLLVGGAAVWGYSDYRRRQGEAAHAAAVAAAMPIPTRVAPPSAAPGVAAALPQPSAAGDPTGVYSGPICYGPSEADPARCFRAQAVVRNSKISGQWPARIPGSTMYLAGDITRAGDVAIHMHAQREDGSNFAVIDLVGKLRDGGLDAAGSFRNGRSVTLNWRKD
jgi:class 3 adenylate cyclase